MRQSLTYQSGFGGKKGHLKAGVPLPRSRRLRDGLFSVYVSGVAVSVLFVSFLDFGNFIQIYTGGLIAPKHVYLILVLSVVPILILKVGTVVELIMGRQAVWIFGLLVLNIGHWMAMRLDGDVAAAALTSTRAQYLALVVLLLFAIRSAAPSVLFRAFVFLSLLLSVSQVVDFFNPGLFVPIDTEGYVLGRAGSTLINANKAVEALLLVTVLGMPSLGPTARLFLLFAALPGVLLSFSRSGLIGWFLVLAFGFLFRAFPRKALLYMIPLLAAFLTFLVGLLPELILPVLDPSSLADIYSRLSFWSSGDLGDDSARERFAVATAAIESFFRHPVVGNGAGYTFFWAVADVAPHNQHLLVLAEYGLIGYLFFVVIATFSVKKDGFIRAEAHDHTAALVLVLVAWFSLFTHNMFDHIYWLLTLGMLTCRRALNRGGDGYVGKVGRVCLHARARTSR
jgi:hypothetical protein